MSPHEVSEYRERLDAACARFGWVRRGVTVEHERDRRPGYETEVWFAADGRRLFAEDDLTPALADELIRLAGLV